jgi:hypothetical protein
VVDDIHGERKVEGFLGKCNILGASTGNLNRGRTADRLFQHLFRRVNAPTLAANGFTQQTNIVPRATTDLEHKRVAVNGAVHDQMAEHFRMDATMPGIVRRNLLIVTCHFLVLHNCMIVTEQRIRVHNRRGSSLDLFWQPPNILNSDPLKTAGNPKNETHRDFPVRII